MRTAALLALSLAASPLPAQTASIPDAPPPPASNGVVGPRELQDFSLPGTVVRPGQPAPVTATPREPRPAPPSATPAPDITAPRDAPRAAAPSFDRPTPSAKAPTTTVTPPPINVAPPTASSPGITAPPPSLSEPLAPATPITLAPTPAHPAPWWPWLLALLAAAGAAAFVYYRRQHDGETHAYAGAGLSETLPVAPRAPAPVPAPVPRAVAPIPAPPAPVPDGIVSTALRPELQFTFTPLSVAIDEAGTAMVVFDLVVYNQGSAPARDVLVEAGMFNAGPQQDEVIGTFFANPRAEGDRIPIIAPMSRIGVRSRVSIASDHLAPVEMEGRKLLVPLVAFNALYRWSGGETQRSASFLVGRGSNDALKLAPFALDRGSRAWGDVAARTHSAGLVAA